MIVDEPASNGDGKDSQEAGEHLKPGVVNNGCAIGNNAGEPSSVANESLRTYKRRKVLKSVSDGQSRKERITSMEAEKTKKKQQNVDSDNSRDNISVNSMNVTQDASLRHWRNVVLTHIYHSLVVDGGLQRCIRDALLFHPEIDFETIFKGYFSTDVARVGEPSNLMPDRSNEVVKSHMDAISKRSINEASHQTTSERCQHAFYDVITSEKFASLCKLLLENFQGLKDDNLFGLNLVNARMKEGAYESSPQLFSADIQQVWTNLKGIGSAMISLAKSLSEISRISYNELVGGPLPSTSEGGNHEESDSQTAPVQMRASDRKNVCRCKSCGGKADGKDCLVCDSCEEMYHVSCIEPAIKEIPAKSWYCTSCTATGIGSPHADCLVCERMNDTEMQTDGVGDEEIPESKGRLEEKEDDLGCDMEENLRHCKICGTEVRGDGFRVCSHPFCPHRYYHEHCLTARQLKAYGPRWYCLSCLCNACLTDRDDDQIVLCDGCDHAYHIYCMKPPRTSVPRGKWFCTKCDSAIREIRRVRLAYEKKHGKGCTSKKPGKKPNEQGSEMSDKGREGMDMLLSAAKTLNSEENLDATQKKG